MNRRDRRLLAAVIVIAVAAVVALVVLVTRNPNPNTLKGVASEQTTTIQVPGATLAAEVITPKGSGPAPLLVIPGAWGAGATPQRYRVFGARFARAGYQVVAYAQRGWGGSTGDADIAGAPTQQDASDVITWALKHTRGDPKRIGMIGMSYGAGVSLLAAAHDKRVRAVVALSTWTDVARALDYNDTASIAAVRILIGPSRAGRFDSTVKSLQQTLTTDPVALGGAIRNISVDRSPSSYVQQLNANRPAIMIGNAFEDSIFTPAQVIPFYDSLTTPKRLELAPGDHGGPELASLTGGDSPTVDDAQSWLDHYLRGVNNGIENRPPILLRDINTGAVHEYRSWPTATAADRTSLGSPGAKNGPDPATTWSGTLRAGVDSAATNGVAQYVPSAAYHVPQADVALINTDRALVWTGARETKAVTVRGTPSLHLTLASSSGTASIYAYLYDVAPNGMGKLVDMAPFSTTGVSQPRSVTFSMQPTCYTVPAGDRLALVVDAADPWYESLTTPGTTMTISSSPADPAVLTVPSSS